MGKGDCIVKRLAFIVTALLFLLAQANAALACGFLLYEPELPETLRK